MASGLAEKLWAGAPRLANEGQAGQAVPSLESVTVLLGRARQVLFPWHFLPAGRPALEAELVLFEAELTEQVARALPFSRRAADASASASASASAGPEEIASAVLHRLPALQAMLCLDVAAAFDGDPALQSMDEPIICYPGIVAMTFYRLAHELHSRAVPLIPRMMTEQAHVQTGIDIHPGARIGARCFIDHGTGTVIGETSVIGDRVRIYQGVTLGSKSFPVDPKGRTVIKGLARHPIVEDDVVIYSGATILGRITIGRGSTIGGNVWVTRDVPAGSTLTQAQAVRTTFSDGGGI